MNNKICGLGQFAKDAAKAGYVNPTGGVNLLIAREVVKKYGKLVPKKELSKEEWNEINEAARKISEQHNLKTDVFQKSNI